MLSMLTIDIVSPKLMITKELVQSVLANRESRSRNLKTDRWVLATKIVLTEMLETYRYPGDRDNDSTFIPYLVDLALSKDFRTSPLVMCPFEQDRTDVRRAKYSLKFNKIQLSKFEEIRVEKGWSKQTLLANAVYTGLLYEYPDFEIGQKYIVEIIEYPNLILQPNAEWLKFQDEVATVSGINNVRDPWIECDCLGYRKNFRKDWLRAV